MWDSTSFIYGTVTGIFGSIMLIGSGLWIISLRKKIDVSLVFHLFHPLEKSPCIGCGENVKERETVVECASCHQSIGHGTCTRQWMNQYSSCPHCKVVILYDWMNK